jgi:hypothetical protein
VPGGLLPDLVGNRVRPVGQPGDGKGSCEGGTFGVGEVGASRQATTAKRRSSVSPACLALRAPASTQKLQPLIWLTRRWTSSRVTCGTPPFLVALSRAWMPCGAKGKDRCWVAHSCVHETSP